MPPHPKRWTLAEYNDMIASNVLSDLRVQLVDGEILEMSPHGNSHALSITLVQDELLSAFPMGHVVRIQLPISIVPRSQPEPDIAVVRGRPRDFPVPPTTAVLVVEVSDSSLAFDLGKKAALYAAAGIADYWVLDIFGRRLIVHRQPVVDAGGTSGYRFADVRTLTDNDQVNPLAMSTATIKVGDLLP